MVNSILANFYNHKEKFIGIVMHHGAEQIAAMLAVLKSGAAYVPAETFLPKDRIDYKMKTAGVKPLPFSMEPRFSLKSTNCLLLTVVKSI